MMAKLMAIPVLVALYACSFNGRADGSTADVVQLIDGPDELTLRNRLVSVTMQKMDGKAHPQVDGLSSSAFPAAANLLRAMPKGGGCYWTTVPDETQTNGSKVDCDLSGGFVGHTVVRQSASLVEIAFATAPACGFQADFHYVLRADEPGYHFFVAVNRTGDEELQLALANLRLACRLDQDIFTTVIVPDEAQTTQAARLAAARAGALPPVSELQDEFQVMNAGYRLHNASASGGVDVPANFYTKYSWAVSADADLVHGAVGGGTLPTVAAAGQRSVGVFMIQPSHEYLNGGPAHAEIATHQDHESTCFLFHGAGPHYGWEAPVAPPGWRKLIGPAFVRIDAGPDAPSLWAAAVQSATELQRQWPYSWMQHELWQPPAQRGGVRGSLAPTAPLDRGPTTPGGYAILGDPVRSPAKVASPECVEALQVRCAGSAALPAPECAKHCMGEMSKAGAQSVCTPQTLDAYCDGTMERPLDMQGLGYVFWSNVTYWPAGGAGTFDIRGARAGQYSLWVRVPGCVPPQQLVLPRLTVDAGAVIDLGRLAVPNQRHGTERIWQIGLADASVAEFKHGRDAMDHGWMLWLEYPREFPGGVDFTVGKSDPATDWNFMQPLLAPTPATSPSCQSCPLDPPASLNSTWRITFDTAVLRGYQRVALTVGVLSANGHATGIDILLNSKVTGRINATAFQTSETGKIVDTHVDARAWVLSGAHPPFAAVFYLDPAHVAAALLARDCGSMSSTLELRLHGPYKNGCTDAQCPSASVLYDYIRLGGDPAPVASSAPQQPAIDTMSLVPAPAPAPAPAPLPHFVLDPRAQPLLAHPDDHD